MEAEFVTSYLANMFEIGLKVAMPILLLTLLVGLGVSIIQVVTQIQEMTLTFVPKIFISVVALGLFGNWMLGLLIEFTTNSFRMVASF